MSLVRKSLVLSAISAAIALSLTGTASAELTPTERTQVQRLYVEGRAERAPDVRAMLGRPDLTRSEAAEAFVQAAEGISFDIKHSTFVEGLLFGPATEASRSALVPPVVAGLLARASASAAAAAGGDRPSAAELLRIYAFIAREIASAGAPPDVGHDASAAINDDALRDVIEQMRAHLALPALDPQRVTGPLRVARAQAEIALVELSSGLSSPLEVGGFLGLKPTEQALFEKTGFLVTGLSEAPANKADALVTLLGFAGLGASDASLVWLGKPALQIVSRRGVITVAAPLRSNRALDPARLWSSGAGAAGPDAALAEVAFVLARGSIARLVVKNKEFRDIATGAAARAEAAGPPGYLSASIPFEALRRTDKGGCPASPTSLVAHAARLLWLDAPRTLSLALSQSLAGRNEPMEQLTLAIGALASGANGSVAPELTVGRVDAQSQLTPIVVTKIEGGAAVVQRFTMEGHEYALARGSNGAVHRVYRDDKPLTAESLASP